MSRSAPLRTEPDELRGVYGELILHAENPVSQARRRTVRWAFLLALAATLIIVAVTSLLHAIDPGDSCGPPPWWFYVLFLPGGALMLWGLIELLRLLSAWAHVGWSVDVYEEGVVESRFGRVRSAMPFSGGVLDRGGFLLTSPHPREALALAGRQSCAHHYAGLVG